MRRSEERYRLQDIQLLGLINGPCSLKEI